MDSRLLVMTKHKQGGWQRQLTALDGKQSEAQAAKLVPGPGISLLAATSTGLVCHASSDNVLTVLDADGNRRFEKLLDEPLVRLTAVPDVTGNIVAASARHVTLYDNAGSKLWSFETKRDIAGMCFTGSKLLLSSEGEGGMDVWELHAQRATCLATVPTKLPVVAVATLTDGRVCTGVLLDCARQRFSDAASYFCSLPASGQRVASAAAGQPLS
jgi:hypothetical protein